MHVCGRGVARLTGVDDDHRAALASELGAAASPAAEPPTTATSQCRSTVRGVMVLLGLDDRVSPDIRTNTCRIRKNVGGAMADTQIEQVVR